MNLPTIAKLHCAADGNRLTIGGYVRDNSRVCMACGRAGLPVPEGVVFYGTGYYYPLYIGQDGGAWDRFDDGGWKGKGGGANATRGLDNDSFLRSVCGFRSGGSGSRR